MQYRDNRFIDKYLIGLYRFNNRFLRKAIRLLIIDRNGAGFFSNTIRTIYSKYHNVHIGMYSMDKEDHYASFPSGTTIGRYSSIAKDIIILNGSHPVLNRSTHAFFFNPKLGYVNHLGIKRRSKLDIGNDVYIGINVMILPNVTSIGTGSVIAAGSVVIKDVPPYAIVGGNPAKLIRYRFSEGVIRELLKSKWWDKDIEELVNDRILFKTFLHPLESNLVSGITSESTGRKEDHTA